MSWLDVGPGGQAVSSAIGVRAALVTEVVMFNFGRLPPHNTTRPHLHTFHQIDVVLEGRVQHEAEGMGLRELGPGDALLVAPLARHESLSNKGFVHASFKAFLAPQAARRLGSACFVFRPGSSVVHLLRDVGAAVAGKQAHAAEAAIAAAALVVVEALRAHPVLSPQPAPFDEFRRMILPVLQPVDENPSAQWTVESMAEACHLSVDHFSRCFHRVLRQTPREYLLRARMRRAAAEIIATPAVPIKEVAQRVGYSSVQTFSRAFRTTVGLTPAAFRASPQGASISQYL